MDPIILESQSKAVKNTPSHREDLVSWLESGLYHFVKALKNKRNTDCFVYDEVLYVFVFVDGGGGRFDAPLNYLA